MSRSSIQVLAVVATTAVAAAAHAGDPALSTEVVATGLDDATYVTSAPNDPSRLYVLEQGGVIRLIKDGVLLPDPFLDIDDLVPDEPYNGLLGMAFHPDFASNGTFYLHHPRGGGSSDRLTIAKYTVSADPDLADAASRDEILVLPFPSLPGHHAGGAIHFGPDGYLYIPLGDGGTTGQETPGGARAQSLTSPWGKILRLDVNGDDYPADPDRDFAIPPDNPWTGILGGEMAWARGLRNPYRSCFDSLTGDFWIADVGRSQREEIDFQPASSHGRENYGWNCAEGLLCSSNDNCTCGPALVDPIHEYPHGGGRCSLSGGAIYRGCAIPGLEGTYFFGDWCSAQIWSLRQEGGVAVDVEDRTAELDPPGPATIGGIISISAGPYGELYITDGDSIFRIVPAGGINDVNGNGIADECEIPGDLDGDGVVGFQDLLLMLSLWGECGAPCPPACDGDVDGNCAVDFVDLLTLFSNWS